MNLKTIIETGINPAMALLPPAMDSKEARVMLLAIGLQESRFEFRRQLGNGPARGFYQFEMGTRASRGGVWGVWLHDASRYWLARLCDARGCKFEPRAIWEAIEFDDVLAAGVARLLLFTDAQRLPAIGQEAAAWNLYALRCWRPGKPHRITWSKFYSQAVNEVMK